MSNQELWQDFRLKHAGLGLSQREISSLWHEYKLQNNLTRKKRSRSQSPNRQIPNYEFKQPINTNYSEYPRNYDGIINSKRYNYYESKSNNLNNYESNNLNNYESNNLNNYESDNLNNYESNNLNNYESNNLNNYESNNLNNYEISNKDDLYRNFLSSHNSINDTNDHIYASLSSDDLRNNRKIDFSKSLSSENLNVKSDLKDQKKYLKSRHISVADSKLDYNKNPKLDEYGRNNRVADKSNINSGNNCIII